MLYPKREQNLTAEDFQNPSSEYRATPFWAWNNKLNADELVWQIEQLKKLGFGGFHIHVRTGMATEYLSNEYMNIVYACVEKARAEKMLAWLYDEDRWPSGAAGGIVTKDKRYRQRYLRLTRHPATAERDNKLIACFDISLSASGQLEQYRRVKAEETIQGFRLYAYAETASPDPWYNKQTYVNTLDAAAIREFIRVTHERYKSRFASDFGGVIPAIFTDEPQFSRKETLRFAHEDRDVTLPWTDDLAETFAAAYAGENLIDGIPELLWDLPQGAVSVIRYHYHDHICERFTAAFADQCGAWCSANNIMLTGHMMEEPTLESQTHAIGEAMRSYRSFQLPGIDMLCDQREFTTAKQTQSAVRQYAYAGMLSELYGVTNWDFDFRGHKLQGDWQAALGVTVRVPHLSWISMNGEAKRDYPGTFNYQAPWYEQYPYIENHFARINTALTRGKAVARVGVIHPIESYWLHWGPRESTQAIREQMDQNFHDLCNWLLRGLIDFDYIAESTLPALCDLAAISANKPFPVGKMSYDVIIVPALETIRATTLCRLEAFQALGGRLIFLGTAPQYLDARPSTAPRQLWQQSERIGFERLPLLSAIADVRELSIRDRSGVETQNLLYQMREEADGSRWLFIAHADKPLNPDLPRGDIIRIRIKGEWRAAFYDTLSGAIRPQPVAWERGDTLIAYALYEHDSLLFKLEKGAPPVAAPEPPRLVTSEEYPNDTRGRARFTSPVPVTLHEPNLLLLDMAEYALDDEPYRPAEEVLRLDTILRTELGWPLRKKAVAQPWVESDTSTPRRLRLRYTFDSELEINGAELALENAAVTQVSLNAVAAGPVNGWYVDHGINKVKLPLIRKGLNTLELSLPYGRKIDVEASYLLGDFGVRVAGIRCTLTTPVRELAFGDITRQGLAFYGGNISYHLTAESRGGELTISASAYRGHVLRVKVDGEDRGVIAFSPYRLTVTGLKDGLHRLELLYFGCRINTFGQLHTNVRDPGYWWGVDSWRAEGDAWTYEYRFWKQGVLKSPEIE
ncbi:MAG: hypothetical protein LBC46_02150 [Treponema sp.]|jgi:hypothetical protein|nr:hypothetical protein [Treponema sp.]